MENNGRSQKGTPQKQESTLMPLGFTAKRLVPAPDFPPPFSRRPSFFNNQISNMENNKIISVITPLKHNESFRLESVIKTPLDKDNNPYAPISILNSVNYEINKDRRDYLYEERNRYNVMSKNESIDKEKRLFEHSQNLSQNEFDTSRPRLNSSDSKDSDSPKNINFSNIEIPIANIPYVPIKKLGCNCKNSQCLKLYCECFRNNMTCNNSCNCVSCKNKTNNKNRANIIKMVKEKNPKAFEPKFHTRKIPLNNINDKLRKKTMTYVVSRGCNCKNSNCIKKYCECFQYGIKCGGACQCKNCKNKEPNKANTYFKDLRILEDDKLLGKREEFDIKNELKNKLLEIKRFKINFYSRNN